MERKKTAETLKRDRKEMFDDRAEEAPWLELASLCISVNYTVRMARMDSQSAFWLSESSVRDPVGLRS